MVVKNSGNALLQLRTLFNVGAIGALSDGQLLERFATARGEPRELAFAALVERHGPFVLRVCHSVLRDENAAEDAFQATFLALAQGRVALGTRFTGPLAAPGGLSGCGSRPIGDNQASLARTRGGRPPASIGGGAAPW